MPDSKRLLSMSPSDLRYIPKADREFLRSLIVYLDWAQARYATEVAHLSQRVETNEIALNEAKREVEALRQTNESFQKDEVEVLKAENSSLKQEIEQLQKQLAVVMKEDTLVREKSLKTCEEPTLPVPSALFLHINRAEEEVKQGYLQEAVYERSFRFIALCNEKSENSTPILDRTTVGIADGVVTLGWPDKRVYVDFFTNSEGGTAQEILLFPESKELIEGKSITQEEFFALFQ